MNRNSGAESDTRGVEVIKDMNGIGFVILLNQRGASARVRFFNSH